MRPKLNLVFGSSQARNRRLGMGLCGLIALFAIVALAPGARAASAVSLVSDIRPASPTDWGSNPLQFTAVGDAVFFVAQDASNGRELWRTDGSADGTRLVKDIRPGPFFSDINGLAEAGGALYFAADDGDGIQAWRSDGTAAGTAPFTSPRSPYRWWLPYGFTPIGSYVLFFAATEGLGSELWSIDRAGSVRPLLSPYEAYDHAFVAAGDRLYFSRDEQLWRSDGTPAGTRLVAQLPAPIADLVVVGDTLFLVIRSYDMSGLWRSDGTAAGTIQVKNADAAWPAFVYDLTPANGALYFVSYDDSTGNELWRSDGTVEGTGLVLDLNPGPASAFSRYDAPPQLTAVGSSLYFVADDGMHGPELWRSDGTASGTAQVSDIRPGGEGSFPYDLTPFRGVLAFSADRGDGVRQLWLSDGSAEGTAPVVPGVSGEQPGAPVQLEALQAIGNSLYFGAGDQPQGRELWVSDGTAAGTRMVKDIYRDAGSDPDELTAFDGALYFSAADEQNSRDLWRSDGTAAGTTRIVDVSSTDPRGGVGEIATSGGKLFFSSSWGEPYDAHGSTLWASDGTTAGSVAIQAFEPGDYISSLSHLTDVGGTLFFINAVPYGYGFELWRSDGAAAGTSKLATFMAGDDYIEVEHMLDVGGTLFFSFYDNEYGVKLWKSDGTADGTREVTFEGRWSDFRSLVAIGDTVYFATSEYNQDEPSSVLWKVAPGAASAMRVRAIVPEIRELAVVGHRLFFVAYNDDGHFELWRSDGSSWSTRRIRSFIGPVEQLAVLRGRLLFSGIDANQGREIYSTNAAGSAAFRLATIAPGVESSWPQGMTVGGPEWRALFGASDGRSGLELWRTSGSSSSTRQVADIAPGPGSSTPSDFVVVGSQTFFVADDNHTGRELWVMR